MTCPACSETVLPEDMFCFHCGRRLQPKKSTAGPKPSGSKRLRFSQWPLAVVGAVALLAAGYEIHHQSAIIAHLEKGSPSAGAGLKSGQKKKVVLHPVVTTAKTIYPSNLPSTANWTPEVETYDNVQFGLSLPKAMSLPLNSSTTQWSWGKANSPYHVTLSVASGKTSGATVNLGPNTWGTAITHQNGVESQDLFIQWASQKWVEVAISVPAAHHDWLASIAQSVRVS